MRIDKGLWGNLMENGWPIEQVVVSAEDRAILRGLAEQVAEVAARPEQADKTELWTRHNDLEDTPPPILVGPENSWNEIFRFDRDIVCSGTMAQDWEMWLRKQLYWANVIKDDTPIDRRFYVPPYADNPEWSIAEANIGDEDKTHAYNWKPELEDLTDDEFDLVDVDQLIDDQVVTMDYETSDATLALAEDVLGDILEVKRRSWWFWSSHLVLAYSYYRGIQTMMLDFFDHPKKVHEIYGRLTSTYIEKLKQLEREGLLTSNATNHWVGSGGLGLTNQLTFKEPPDVKLTDMWGLIEQQEASGLSKGMYEEFIFPYMSRVAAMFGLTSVGCCEPLDPWWEVLANVPNLRRVSVSPWANRTKMSEYLGPNYVYSFKVNPSPVTVPNMDEDHVRRELSEFLPVGKANDNRVELILKDLHTLGGTPEDVPRWVGIAREEIAKVY